MSNNKQSSVEWLVNKLADLTFNYIAGFVTKQEYDTQCNKVIEQAKAMHKEEIITTWHKGYDNLSPMIDEDNCGDKYYKKTFGGNNEEQ